MGIRLIDWPTHVAAADASPRCALTSRKFRSRLVAHMAFMPLSTAFEPSGTVDRQQRRSASVRRQILRLVAAAQRPARTIAITARPDDLETPSAGDSARIEFIGPDAGFRRSSRCRSRKALLITGFQEAQFTSLDTAPEIAFDKALEVENPSAEKGGRRPRDVGGRIVPDEHDVVRRETQSKLANSLPNLPSSKKSSASRTLMNGDLDAAIAALRAKEGPRLMSRRMTESLPLPSSAARATFAVSSLDASSTTTTSATSGSRKAEAMATGIVRVALWAAHNHADLGGCHGLRFTFDAETTANSSPVHSFDARTMTITTVRRSKMRRLRSADAAQPASLRYRTGSRPHSPKHRSPLRPSRDDSQGASPALFRAPNGRPLGRSLRCAKKHVIGGSGRAAGGSPCCAGEQYFAIIRSSARARTSQTFPPSCFSFAPNKKQP